MVGFGRLKIIVALVVLVGAAAGGAVALGVLGTPSVESVDNHFAGVGETTTTVNTNLTVNNPNPIGVQLGGTTVNYTVDMNGVDIASGQKEGLSLATGNSTIPFSTQMQNGQIPPWWYTHIENGETTQVSIDATVTSSLLGGRSFSLSQDQTVETDIISQFNSTETRPVNANQPLVSDPVLYINETRGSWDRGNLTRSTTPLGLDFTVYNPKPYPYAVSKIGYTVSMNNVTVGEGETDRGYTLSPGETETIEANAAIQNENLDDWWVTHLQRNQVTDLYIDFYFIVEGGGEQFRIDLDAIDYAKTIETDIFGNKATYPTGTESDGTEADDGSDTSESTATPAETESTDDGGLFDDTTTTDGGTQTSETSTGDGILGDQTETETDTGSAPTETATDDQSGTPTQTPTETATDDGLLGIEL
ncbi:LEA type 2 family protein [Haloarcula marina]|uniref:LEA type 2 family protein n=1 Tax=Haloarcula marina TaxID=2961574 RepID=UPI0020B74AC3|nr:LEA type 2 family protein [Halomicroarcula marina]